MLKLEVLRKYNSISRDTKLCNLGEFSIISGKNGTGKSQLLDAIRTGAIQVSDNGNIPIPMTKIVYESIWSIRSKNIQPAANITSVKELILIVKQYYESYNNSWNFNVQHGNQNVSGLEILEEVKNVNNQNESFHEDGVRTWAEKTLRRTSPFQVDLLSRMLLNYRIKTAYKTLEAERLELLKNTPWNRLNDFLTKRAGLNFSVLEPSADDIENPQSYTPAFENSFGDKFDVAGLSDGEKVLLTIAVSILSAENKDLIVPKVLLLDEVDATLHPSMILNLIRLLRDAFVTDNNIHVIFTTHSPTTIALADEESLYYMSYDNDMRLRKSSRDEILKDLAYGIPTLSVTYRNRRNVIVESENDANWLERLYRLILSKGKLTSEISLNFISSGVSRKKQSGTDQTGNCENVKAIVKAFNDINMVCGLIDQDKRGSSAPDGIFILTDGERYSLENLLLDPIWIVNYFRANTDLGIFQNKKYGFTVCDGDIQKEVDLLVEKVKSNLSTTVDDNNITDVEYCDGSMISIPRWYLNYNGHDLGDVILATFAELGKHQGDGKKLRKSILSHLELHFEICPKSLIDTLTTLTNPSKMETTLQ